MNDRELGVLEQRLWPKGFRRNVWMVVDAARDQRIFSFLLDCHLEYSCLYSGSLAPEVELAAPYLVGLEYEHKNTRRLLQQAWGKSWAILAQCELGMNSLRRHLRTLLVVRDPKGNRLVFRYYDPRVLRVYFPTCTPEELETVFGPIERFAMEDESGAILEFSLDGPRLVRNTVALEQAA